MRNGLPKHIWRNETAIVNLDDTNGPGTHWVCYKKLTDTVFYFDSFGNLPPPKELAEYFEHVPNVVFNYEGRQKKATSVCGHLCLEFLATCVSQM